ncbi:iron-sulfur cluster repair di-iron protein [bacterium]|nr:iron-sulfur cluster repair di-iron protein [bacterium]
MAISIETTVGDLVAEGIHRARVFETYGIDYCCGGKTPLTEACRIAGCTADEVVAALVAADRDAGGGGPETTDWRAASLTKLTTHIVQTHHAFMKRELPRVADLLAKVRNAHGENHPELADLAQVYGALRAELEAHLAKEEQVLFPLIQEMEATRQAGSAHCGSVNNPIGVMEHEHDNAGIALGRMRELTNDYTLPQDGCATFAALLDGLAAIERDLHEHIHKENNILHPRAARLEADLLAAARSGA